MVGASSTKAPYDCHGHVVRALILIKAGHITQEDYFATQAEYLLRMEGSNWINLEARGQEICRGAWGNSEDSKSDPGHN